MEEGREKGNNGNDMRKIFNVKQVLFIYLI